MIDGRVAEDKGVDENFWVQNFIDDRCKVKSREPSEVIYI